MLNSLWIIARTFITSCSLYSLVLIGVVPVAPPRQRLVLGTWALGLTSFDRPVSERRALLGSSGGCLPNPFGLTNLDPL
jgi:hypothetical protein